MPDIKITHTGEALAAALRHAPDLVVEEMQSGLFEASLLIEREVRENTPTSGAGTLRDSIAALEVTFDGSVIEGGVGTPLAYAAPVEDGSRPHMPPATPIMEWVRRKLGVQPEEIEEVTERIRWKIFRHGTPAHHMFQKGFDATSAQVREILAASAGRAIARVGA